MYNTNYLDNLNSFFNNPFSNLVIYFKKEYLSEVIIFLWDLPHKNPLEVGLWQKKIK